MPTDGTPSSPLAGISSEASAAIDQALTSAFGGADGQPSGEADASSSAPSAAQAPMRSRGGRTAEQVAESLASLEGADEEDLRGTSFEPSGKDGEDALDADGGEEGEGDSQAEGDGTHQARTQTPGTLTPSLLRAAERSGWAKGEAEALYKANPTLAVRTLERLSQSQLDMARRYSQIGEAGQGQQQAGKGEGGEQRSNIDPSSPDHIFAELYGGQDKVDALRGRYGDELFTELLAPILKPVMAAHQALQRQEQQAVVQEVETFFASASDELPEVYGKKGDEPDKAQVANRLEVMKLADRIRAGAATQGVIMTVTDAMDQAHRLFTTDRIKELERKRLASSVRKRSGQISSRPTNRTSPTHQQARGLAAAMDAYAQRADELGLPLADTGE